MRIAFTLLVGLLFGHLQTDQVAAWGSSSPVKKEELQELMAPERLVKNARRKELKRIRKSYRNALRAQSKKTRRILKENLQRKGVVGLLNIHDYRYFLRRIMKKELKKDEP